ncbi:MAG: NAD(P)/FAD-dependent oxidoreductase [Candidatus Thorarchaeota archaeon]
MRIVVVGYGPGGVAAAVASRTFSPKAEVKIITEETVDAHRKPGASLALEFPDTSDLSIADWSFRALSEKGIEVISGTRVISGDPSKKTLELEKAGKSHSTLAYDKLILATGGRPNIPDIPGTDLPGVFTIQDMPDASTIGKKLSGMKRVVIVGAGFSGLETAERLVSLGKETHMIVRSRFMRRQLEEPMSSELASRIPSSVRLHLGKAPKSVDGNTKVESITVGDEAIPTDAVIFMTGVRPDVTLARSLGVAIGELGGIVVDVSMQTSVSDIYAVGDCVEMTDPLSEKPILLPVGSVAARAGRQAGVAAVGGTKIYADTSRRLQYDRIFGTDIVCIGHSTTTAAAVGIEVKAEYFEDPAEFTKAALIVDKSGTLVGGQVISSRMGARLAYEIFKRVESRATLRDAPLLKPRHERLKEYIENTFGPIR